MYYGGFDPFAMYGKLFGKEGNYSPGPHPDANIPNSPFYGRGVDPTAATSSMPPAPVQTTGNGGGFTPYGPYGPGGAAQPNYASMNFGQAFAPFPNMDTQATAAFAPLGSTMPSNYGRWDMGGWPGMGGGWPASLFAPGLLSGLFAGAGGPAAGGMGGGGTTPPRSGAGSPGGVPGGLPPTYSSPSQQAVMAQQNPAAAAGLSAAQLNAAGVGGQNYNPLAVSFAGLNPAQRQQLQSRYADPRAWAAATGYHDPSQVAGTWGGLLG